MLNLKTLRWALLLVAAWLTLAASATTPAPGAGAQAISAAGAASQPAAPASGRRKAAEFVKMAKRGELVVAMLKTDSPPFFYLQGNELQGIDVEMAREIGKELNLPVRFDRSANSFNEVVDIVSRGEADLGISKISRTLARTQAVLFSEPYLTLHHALILNRLEFAKMSRDNPAAQAVRDFRGSLGVIANSSFADFAAHNFPKAKVRPYASWDALVAAVQAGEVVGGYRDELEVKRLLSEQPSAALRLRTVTLKDLDDTIGIAVGADAPSLHAYVNLFLTTRKKRLDIGEVLKAMPATDNQAKTP
jgi:polar amino acid transport system substrate-binding protein